MQLVSLTSAAIAAASLPLASAQLNYYAKEAGLTYFGSATDTPGFRERAGLEAQYSQYDAIMADTKEFGQTTPTNGMKWMFIEPEQGVFNFTEGDIVADLAKKNGQLLRCHTLVWHSQLAPWVENRTWTAEELSAVIVNHITNVMTHYKGRCAHWDVVNEAIEDDGTWRNSIFYRTMGTDYIKLAFKTAALIDPSAKLYYNDYNLERVRDKSRTAVKLVQMLKADGIRIDGVGMQGHLTVGAVAPPIDQYLEVYKMYTAEGVEIALTELDVRLELPANETNLAIQKTIYTNVVGACVQVKGCVGVTLWDWYDPFSWIPYVFPGMGAAHLWFADFSKHPAYYGIIDALKNATKHECKARRAAAKRSAKLFTA